ncbi:MAG: hypothetical protein LAT57_07625 [Balneolales bacterium]|nr:hypothetical protein [Balneolales bacterium]
MKIKASDIEKAFLLKSVEPFDKLDERTLFNLVSVMTLTQYEPNKLVLDSQTVCNEVLIVVDGDCRTESSHKIFLAGVHSVLEDLVIGESISSGSAGAKCLRIGKGHFLTTMYECPFILVDLIRLRNQNPNYCL